MKVTFWDMLNSVVTSISESADDVEQIQEEIEKELRGDRPVINSVRLNTLRPPYQRQKSSS
jgi:hypothetical protein